MAPNPWGQGPNLWHVVQEIKVLRFWGKKCRGAGVGVGLRVQSCFCRLDTNCSTVSLAGDQPLLGGHMQKIKVGRGSRYVGDPGLLISPRVDGFSPREGGLARGWRLASPLAPHDCSCPSLRELGGQAFWQQSTVKARAPWSSTRGLPIQIKVNVRIGQCVLG